MPSPPRVLFIVEGNTDIRFVVGLSEICDLTMVIPAGPYVASGLKDRIAEAGAAVQVHEIRGGRLAFQARTLARLARMAPRFDLILAQEALRGALSANLVGLFRRVPVVTYMGIAPREYFRCRLERGQISWPKWRIGDAVIESLLTVNGLLAARCLTMGPYLRQVARRYSRHTEMGLYYGVDTELFRPADTEERKRLRQKWKLPEDRFIVFFSSRVSHEKDPQTVLQATELARARGLDAVVLNLGGGYRDFLQLARTLGLTDSEKWVIGGPALHPMKDLADIYRSIDVLAQASHAEGLGLSPLEALASGTPVVATAVGGMAAVLPGHARLVPRQDAPAMAEQFLWIAANPALARAAATRAREELVIPNWSRAKAFQDLGQILADFSRERENRRSQVTRTG